MSLPVACLAASGAWTTDGPAETMMAVTVSPSNPNILYAGSNDSSGGSGVFKSIDGGSHWKDVNNGNDNKRINVVAVDPKNPDIAYAGYEGEGVYKTVDGGSHWKTINQNPIHHGTAIAIDPNHTNTIYIGTDMGLYKSVDGGATCNRLSNGFPDGRLGPVLGVAIDPRHTSTVYAVCFHEDIKKCGIWKTTDAGSHWIAIDNGVKGGFISDITPDHRDTAIMMCRIAIDPRHSNVLYAGSLGGGVFKTINGGDSWLQSNDGINTGQPWGIGIYSLAIDPKNTDTVYAGTVGGGVFRTTDAGRTWKPLNTGLPDQAEHNDSEGICWDLTISHSKDAKLYLANSCKGGGIYSIDMR